MSRALRFDAAAERELNEAVDFYDLESPGLGDVFLAEVEHALTHVPAWVTSRLKRLARSPKRYVVDPGLVGAALRVDIHGVMRDGGSARAYHLRQQQGRHEVDVVPEVAGGWVIGVEVQAEAAPTVCSARHLARLRDAPGDRFIAGVVLHTGPRPHALCDWLWALPTCALWGGGGRHRR